MTKPTVCEERVFHDLYEKYKLTLSNFLYYKFGDQEQARDCAQESFVRLWNNCAKVPFEKAKSYLFTVANRLFLDHAGHQKVVLKFHYRQSENEARYESNPEHVYRESELKVRLETAISDLPEKQRTVFLLSRIDQLKNKEIAESLDISIKTVEKHLAHALRALKERLDEIEGLKF